MVCVHNDLSDLITYHDFDIVGITETWLTQNHNSSDFGIDNYDLIRFDRNTRGGGVAFYIKKGIKHNVYYSNNDDLIEQLWLQIVTKSCKIGLGLVYRSTSSNVDINQFTDRMRNVTEQLYLEVDDVIFMGDININMFDNNSRDVKYFNNFLCDYDLVQIVKEPTRITNNSSTLIDVICISNQVKVGSVKTIDSNKTTDHMLVSCNLDLEYDEMSPRNLCYRDFSKMSVEYFSEDAANSRWDNIYNIDNLDDKLNYLNVCITNLFDKHAPFKNTLVNNTKKSSKIFKPYITYNVKKMIMIKKKAHRKYLKSRSDRDRQTYIEWRNFVKHAIKSEQKAYYKFELNKSRNNPKELWKNLKNWNIKTKSDKTNFDLPDHLSDVDKLNDYFVNDVKSSPIDENTNKLYRETTFSDHVFHFESVSPDEIMKQLNSIKSNATGKDGISLKMLKLVIPYCLDHLTHIINASLISGHFPHCWKSALVKPLTKGSNPKSFNDLRPL